jgi:PIN domain nuclease of toxin-antitoxin system
VRLLLDTHVLLWALGDPDEIEPTARSAIVAPENRVLVSAASTWEIAIKGALGKLKVPADLPQQLEAEGFEPLPITIEHTLKAGALPRHHADPFDRMLVAQAELEDLTIVTRDERIARYAVPTLSA